MPSQPAQQIPGVYHRKIGDIVVTTISDGYLDGNLEVMRNVDVEKARQILQDAFRPARRTSVNTFLIHSKGRTAIIDTGSGNYLQPTAGHVQRNLAAAGIDPKSIDTVLLTHMHPDHSAGLTDMSNGERLFPNAELVMHENELAHWFDDGAMSKVDERSRQLYFGAGREQVAPYKDRTRLFKQGEVFPGVTAVPSLGHTPGHTAYLIASGNDQLMIWGDTVHVPEVQTAFPEAGMAFDTDLAAAAASRKADVRSRQRRRHPDRRDAPAFPGVLAACTARRRLRALSGGLGSQSVRIRDRDGTEGCAYKTIARDWTADTTRIASMAPSATTVLTVRFASLLRGVRQHLVLGGVEEASRGVAVLLLPARDDRAELNSSNFPLTFVSNPSLVSRRCTSRRFALVRPICSSVSCVASLVAIAVSAGANVSRGVLLRPALAKCALID